MPGYDSPGNSLQHTRIPPLKLLPQRTWACTNGTLLLCMVSMHMHGVDANVVHDHQPIRMLLVPFPSAMWAAAAAVVDVRSRRWRVGVWCHRYAVDCVVIVVIHP